MSAYLRLTRLEVTHRWRPASQNEPSETATRNKRPHTGETKHRNGVAKRKTVMLRRTLTPWTWNTLQPYVQRPAIYETRLHIAVTLHSNTRGEKNSPSRSCCCSSCSTVDQAHSNFRDFHGAPPQNQDAKSDAKSQNPRRRWGKTSATRRLGPKLACLRSLNQGPSLPG